MSAPRNRCQFASWPSVSRASSEKANIKSSAMPIRAGIQVATFRITTLSDGTWVYTDRCRLMKPSVEPRFGTDGRGADLMKLKLSDWVANKVVDHGIRHVFMITGGGAMHLNHSFASHQGLACIFNH